MIEQILHNIGLTKSQSKAYLVLIKNNPSTPPALASLIDESRSNTYKLLEQLEILRLVSKDTSGKKITYWANSPGVLSDIAKQKQQDLEAKKRQLDANMPQLLSEYFEHTIQPAVRFTQGRDGIVEVFEDYVQTKQDLYLVRSWKDRDYLGKGILSVWRKRPSTIGLTTHILAPDTESSGDKKFDDLFLIDKTWIREEDYDAPVEWCAYGDKLAIISYGSEAVSMIIQSKQIAQAFKQLFNILSSRQKEWKYYNQFPQKAQLSDDPLVSDTKEYKDVVAARKKYIQSNDSQS
jgi:sugar-specific transcriptional regulator TrmB